MKNYLISCAFVVICANVQNSLAQDSILKCSPTAYIEKYKDDEIKRLESKLIKPVPSLARLIAGNAIMEGVYFSGSSAINMIPL